MEKERKDIFVQIFNNEYHECLKNTEIIYPSTLLTTFAALTVISSKTTDLSSFCP